MERRAETDGVPGVADGRAVGRDLSEVGGERAAAFAEPVRRNQAKLGSDLKPQVRLYESADQVQRVQWWRAELLKPVTPKYMRKLEGNIA